MQDNGFGQTTPSPVNQDGAQELGRWWRQASLRTMPARMITRSVAATKMTKVAKMILGILEMR